MILKKRTDDGIFTYLFSPFIILMKIQLFEKRELYCTQELGYRSA